VLAVGLVLLVISLLPRVEDPWPSTIGIEFPFTCSSACGIAVAVLFADSPAARRDRAIRRGGVFGFYGGALLYLLSLAVQLGSQG